MKNGIKVTIVLCISIIICSGCSFGEHMLMPMVDLYDDEHIDCNEDYIVEIKEVDDVLVVEVTQEGKVVSQLQCDENAANPKMIAVGQNGYYLLDESAEEIILVIVNFDSQIIAKKRIPSDVNEVFCRNGYVFLARYSERYFGEINADYFLVEDDPAQDVQVLTQENISTLAGMTLYKNRNVVGYSTEPELKNREEIFYDTEEMLENELLSKGKEYAVLRNMIPDQDKCRVLEYQKGYQIYGWVNCCDDSYQEALANKERPPLSSIVKGIAYKIDTQNEKLEILEEREEEILFTSENKIVYLQDDGKIFCHDRSQDKVKEIACIEAYSSQPDIFFKKDLIIIYDDNVEGNVIRY